MVYTRYIPDGSERHVRPNTVSYFSYKFHPPNVVVPHKTHLPHPWCNKPDISPLYLPLSADPASPAVANFKSGGSAFTQVEKLSKVRSISVIYLLLYLYVRYVGSWCCRPGAPLVRRGHNTPCTPLHL